MLFEQFSDEADFRTRFLRPLLTRLGFLAVAELHGTQEFGKDFVFSELTPFGFIRHYAAVVKHEKSISQSAQSICQTVLSQVKQAFSVAFRLPDSEAVHRVSSVVVFNSGKISENARTWLRSELDEERYGRNVHIFDGERLSQLDLTCTFRQGENLLPRLQGLSHDLLLNLCVWKSMADSLPSFSEGRGSFTSALEGFLACPFLSDQISIVDVGNLLQDCRIIDRIYSRYLAPLSPKNLRDQETETLKTNIARSIAMANKLLGQIRRAQATFRPLSASAS